jgi:NifU-like protein involved in Fe-S cluster formation
MLALKCPFVPPSVFDYFSRALLRPAEDLNGSVGDTLHAPDGATAVFSVRVIDGSVESVNYRCTTCVTLIAVCEHLSESIRGLTASAALSVTSAALRTVQKEIPPERHDRVDLAVEAMHSAVRRVLQGGCT